MTTPPAHVGVSCKGSKTPVERLLLTIADITPQAPLRDASKRQPLAPVSDCEIPGTKRAFHLRATLATASIGGEDGQRSPNP